MCIGKPKIITTKWKLYFPKAKKFKQIQFNQTAYCSWNFILYIINDFTNKKNNLNSIKRELVEEYEKNKINETKIRLILACQGKADFMIKSNRRASIENIIQSENYYITNLDIFLIMNKYKIPIILIAGNKNGLQENQKNLISFGSVSEDFYYIIRVPPPFRAKPPYYNVILKNNNPRISKNDISNEFNELVRDHTITNAFMEYFKNFNVNDRNCQMKEFQVKRAIIKTPRTSAEKKNNIPFIKKSRKY